ncbi:glycosyltransferase family 91 protein [Ascoidea rubescens DSM 1968]|uniref:Glycosyltransferase family 91 protein n=1 Tax=Ascoidea rubescens DSM 1968 TaxID=1344418 RepID=A0A1D2VGG1_9ASCO|nr:glycosyltransferase family 91 protein [Ascoidea rubescens DSM 1968]ODV60751.1 glycosyltransferase family 91 protein [Ascoidea rubescens DSM 1968]
MFSLKYRKKSVSLIFSNFLLRSTTRSKKFSLLVGLIILLLLYHVISIEKLTNYSNSLPLYPYFHSKFIEHQLDQLNSPISSSVYYHTNFIPYNFTLFKNPFNINFLKNYQISQLINFNPVLFDCNSISNNYDVYNHNYGKKYNKNNFLISYPKKKISLSSKSQYLNDLKIFKSQIINSVYSDLLSPLEFKKDYTTRNLKKSWYQYGASSIFFKKNDLFLLTNRIVYSDTEKRSFARSSFLSFQIYDKNWNQLYSKNNKHLYCFVNPDLSNLKCFKAPAILDIPFYFELNQTSRFFGPEDPRILIKKTYYNFYNNQENRTLIDSIELEEPIIIYNKMTNHTFDYYRLIHAFLPFQNKEITFTFNKQANTEIEKNWQPFFNSKNIIDVYLENNENDRNNPTHFTNGYINFIYSIDPLEILLCSLNTGICNFQFQDNIYWNSKKLSVDPVPDNENILFNSVVNNDKISAMRDYNIFIGFPRTHIDDCGCCKVTYRPSFIVLLNLKNSSTYQINSISSSLDFNIDVLNWKLAEQLDSCIGFQNVLIPNSISYWDIFNNSISIVEKQKNIINSSNSELDTNIESKSELELEFDDYMGLMLTEADYSNVLIHIRGFLKFLINELDFFKKQPQHKLANSTDGLSNEEAQNVLKKINSNLLVQCALEDSKRYCSEYGLSHSPFVPSSHRNKNKNPS